jgi:predicted Rossmann-fold nucleotide-binding protein
LIQAGKLDDFPVVLFGTEVWGGLVEWIAQRLLESGKIGQRDHALLNVTDDPSEFIRLIAESYARSRTDSANSVVNP